MPPVEFEPTMSAGERSHTHALDRVTTGTNWSDVYIYIVAQALFRNTVYMYLYSVVLLVSVVIF